jgi:hypothetical protein
MKIKQIINRNRRDFTADFECDFCGDIEKITGYDDANYHHNVIPKMKCRKCGKANNKITSTNSVPEGAIL